MKMYACKYVYMYYACIQSWNMYKHIFTYIYVHMNIHTLLHAYIHTHMYTCTHKRMMINSTYNNKYLFVHKL